MPLCPPDPVADVFCRAFRARLHWPTVLNRAGVHRVTWGRMVRGAPYLSSTLEKIAQAVDSMVPAPDPPDAAAIPTEALNGPDSRQ